MIRTVSLWAPARPPVRLGQAAAAPFQVLVTDVRGNPVKGVSVGIPGAQAVTDPSGTVSFPPRTGDVDVTLTVPQGGGLVVRRRGPADQTLFVQLPVCFAQPILTTPEMIALAAAAAVSGAGFYWNVDALKITGETLFAATIFTSLYRLSCL